MLAGTRHTVLHSSGTQSQKRSGLTLGEPIQTTQDEGSLQSFRQGGDRSVKLIEPSVREGII